MKILLTLTFAGLSLLGCAQKEQAELRTVLIERFKAHEDIQAYQLDPATMADCMIDEIAMGLPGFAGDPRRPQYFTAYARFLTVQSATEADGALAEFERLFDGKKNARMAATSIPEHEFTCMGKLIESGAGPHPTNGQLHRSPRAAP
jgi:hypothetical protein